MKVEIRSVIPAHRSQAPQNYVENSDCGWLRQEVLAQRLKDTLHAQTQQTIVSIEVEEVEGDVEAICTLLRSVVDEMDCPLPPYILVMGAGEDVAATMELYAAGADEVFEAPLVTPILDARLSAIASRLRRSEEVQRIRKRLEDAQEIGNVGSWCINLKTQDVWWSRQIYRVLNVEETHEKMEMEAFISHIYHEDREKVQAEIMGAIDQKASCSFEFRIRLEEGMTRRLYCIGRPVFDESGELFEFEGAIQDIEARWQVESQLRSQEKILSYITAHLPAALYQVRQKQDNSIWMEFLTLGSLPGFDNIRDLTGCELMDFPYQILEEDRLKLYESTVKAATAFEVWADEFRVLDDNNEVRWMSGQSTPERSVDGSIVWRGVLIDITERKLLSEQVQHADRLSTIGTMAAGVAHEVNNPLVYLLGNLQFVLELLESEIYDGDMIEPAKLITLSGAEIEEMRRALSSARSGAERIRVIVEDLMTFGRASPVHDELVDLRRIGRSAARMMDSQIRHRATLRCSFGEVPLLRSNGGQLRQVLVNLLLNAAQAMTSEKLSENQIDLSIHEHDGFIIIEVEDNGAGISASDKARLFEPFFTTKALSDGTGLGLYVCRNIIEEMGGRIEVESRPGEGSIFRVFLKTL